MTRAAKQATDTVRVERVSRDLYIVRYNSAASEPVPWFRITAKLVVAIMRMDRDESGVGR